MSVSGLELTGLESGIGPVSNLACNAEEIGLWEDIMLVLPAGELHGAKFPHV